MDEGPPGLEAPDHQNFMNKDFPHQSQQDSQSFGNYPDNQNFGSGPSPNSFNSPEKSPLKAGGTSFGNRPSLSRFEHGMGPPGLGPPGLDGSNDDYGPPGMGGEKPPGLENDASDLPPGMEHDAPSRDHFPRMERDIPPGIERPPGIEISPGMDRRQSDDIDDDFGSHAHTDDNEWDGARGRDWRDVDRRGPGAFNPRWRGPAPMRGGGGGFPNRGGFNRGGFNNNRGSPDFNRRGGGPRGFRGPPPGMFGSGAPRWENPSGPFPGSMGPGMRPGGPPPNPMFTDVDGEVWIEYKNDQGRPYYYNCKTQKTVWTKPKLKEEGNHMMRMPGPGMPGPGAMGPSGISPNRMPTGMAGAMPRFPAMPQFGGDLNQGDGGKKSIWSEHKTDAGKVYYYNSITKQSVWERPKDMDGPTIPDTKVAEVDTTSTATNLGVAGDQKISIPGIPDSIAPAIMAARAAAAALAANLGGGQVPNIQNQLNLQTTDQNMGVDEGKDADTEKTSEAPPPESNEVEMQDEVYSSPEQQQQQHHGGQHEDRRDARGEGVKKSEDGGEKGDANKPVAINSVVGTPWCVVWTGDMRSFFYNAVSKESHWVMPDDLKNNAQVAKLLENPPKQKDSSAPAEEQPAKKKPKLEKEPAPVKKSDGIIINVTSNAAAAKPSKTDDSEGGKPKSEKIEPTKYQKDKMSLEERQSAFREMLLDREVSAFSTWDKELHKIVFDPRYLLLSGRERKQAYEAFIKSRAEDERIEKRNKLKDNRDAFKKLIEKANLSSRATFSDFAQKYGKDPKFKAIEKMKEREHLFHEWKTEQSEKKKDSDDTKDGEGGKEEVEDGTSTRERSAAREKTPRERTPAKDKSEERARSKEERSRKTSEKRESGDRRESGEKKRDRKESKESKAARIVKEDFMEMLKTGDVRISPDSHWSKKKKHFSQDERYIAVGSSSTREQYFYEYTKSLEEKEKEPELSESEKKALARKEREAAAMKKREGEVARKQVDQNREWERERGAHAREEAQQHFLALLHDMVRDADASWRKTRKQLREDSRWELCALIDAEQKEKHFMEHIENLSNKRKRSFRKLLDECEHLTLTSTWKEIRRKIKHDPRFSKFSDDDKEREAEFQKHVKDKVATAKTEFKQLLKEIKCVSHKSKEILRGPNGDSHMREIRQFLTNDKRGLVLDDLPEERDQILDDHLSEIEKYGPPPPPTATRPSKR